MPAPGNPLNAAAPAGGPIPVHAGMGLKPAHYAELLADRATRPAWVEVHPENYADVAGGMRDQELAGFTSLFVAGLLIVPPPAACQEICR